MSRSQIGTIIFVIVIVITMAIIPKSDLKCMHSNMGNPIDNKSMHDTNVPRRCR